MKGLDLQTFQGLTRIEGLDISSLNFIINITFACLDRTSENPDIGFKTEVAKVIFNWSRVLTEPEQLKIIDLAYTQAEISEYESKESLRRVITRFCNKVCRNAQKAAADIPLNLSEDMVKSYFEKLFKEA